MHFYSQDGAPRHFVEMSTRPGELRPTRITDAKKHGWIPSVTTILNVLNKPALINWKVNQHIEMAYKMNPADYDSCDEWLRAVSRMTEMEMDKAPSAGTDLHDKLEKYYLGELPQTDSAHDLCGAVAEQIEGYTSYKNWTPEARFTHPYGFAGMVDLHAPASTMGGIDTGWVIDFKTKQTADKFKPGKMAYPDHHRQLAAYRQGLGMPSARCANVFICLEDGQIDIHEHSEADLQKGWATFHDALLIWRRENFDSSFNQEDAA